MPRGLEIIEAFEREIAATAEFQSVAAADDVWAGQLEKMTSGLRTLHHLSDDDPRFLDAYDRTLAAITSDASMKVRTLGVLEAMRSISEIFPQPH